MGSTRFPGKALACDTGRPLLLHVVEAVSQVPSVDRVIVASEDLEIESFCRSAAIDHAMTADTHPNGSSRIAEVAATLDAELILNVQGDEPEISVETIESTIAALRGDPAAGVSTAAAPLTDEDDAADPNIVKVVVGRDGQALYFSRAAVPYDMDGSGDRPLRHIGLYAYRPQILRQYVALPPTPLERTERLEQLRLLEHGVRIAVASVSTAHAGIDTPAQYADFVNRWRHRDPD
jgi:3-deoxy-manno-octulosonate cytidylyltransferase (CMP-KDO synthetase)